MNIPYADTLSLFFLAIGFFGFLVIVYRLVKYVLTVFFGKNIRITVIDADGKKQSKKFRLDKDDDLVALIQEIKDKKAYSRHFFGSGH